MTASTFAQVPHDYLRAVPSGELQRAVSHDQLGDLLATLTEFSEPLCVRTADHIDLHRKTLLDEREDETRLYGYLDTGNHTRVEGYYLDHEIVTSSRPGRPASGLYARVMLYVTTGKNDPVKYLTALRWDGAAGEWRLPYGVSCTQTDTAQITVLQLAPDERHDNLPLQELLATTTQAWQQHKAAQPSAAGEGGE